MSDPNTYEAIPDHQNRHDVFVQYGKVKGTMHVQVTHNGPHEQYGLLEEESYTEVGPWIVGHTIACPLCGCPLMPCPDEPLTTFPAN